MSTKTLWQVTGSEWISTDPEFDTIALNLRANGKDFCVACSGPKNMLSTDFIPALQAAAAAMIMAVGGDASVVGAEYAEDPTFDTGSQRAS